MRERVNGITREPRDGLGDDEVDIGLQRVPILHQ